MAKPIRLLLIYAILLFIAHVSCQSGEELDELDEQQFLLEVNSTSFENFTTFNLVDTYFPLFVLVVELSNEERSILQKYLDEKTYEKLKYELDTQVKISDPELTSNRLNLTDLIFQTPFYYENPPFDNISSTIVEGYHNASIYNAIRSVWLKQLRPFLPIMDQLAIMQKAAEYERMSIWAKLWHNLSSWMYGRHELHECDAAEPPCVRLAMEALQFEERINLDKAANLNRFDEVDDIIRSKLAEYGRNDDLDNWLRRNRPPPALESILEERSEVEEQALQRLRDNGVVNSLKYYYKAVIESRSHEEQEDIRAFFEKMNDTFARCFDPLRGQFPDF
ncbi:unnamed protein product [Caenorhabditis bovis]|uniref:Uncharacterized protein n=1 Tax=Caenorhabditis bovis TaxID=2654633 RepID=A0A8S1EMA1_9PELO|nr:unnamed protein product [Caenorhabditis bovis]